MTHDDPFATLYEMRLRSRGDPQARALVDRSLQLMTRIVDADAAQIPALEAEVEILRQDLALRFGAPKTSVRQ